MASPITRRRRDSDEGERTLADRYKSSRSADEDDEDDEDESPRASRRRAREEEPAPRSRRAARDEDDDDDEPPVRKSRRDRDEDDEDDDEPAPRRKASAGWDAHKKKRAQLGTYANEMKCPDDGEQILIKFLDDEPFAVFALHWIQTENGRRSHVCIEEGCPLCDKLGDTPKAMAAFNVLVLDEKDEPKLFVWSASPGVAQTIEGKAKAKTGPLTREYYAASRTPKSAKGAVQYSLDVVKSRDLHDDWGVTPLTDREIDSWEAKCYDEEKYVKVPSKNDLRELVRTLLDEDD